MLMTAAGHTDFTCSFYPFSQFGPLPPGLTHTFLEKACNAVSIPPARILSILRLQKDSTEPAKRFRREVNSEDFRNQLEKLADRKLQGMKIRSLHETIYTYLIRTFGKAVYRDLIRKCEYTGQCGCLFIDREKFNALLPKVLDGWSTNATASAETYLESVALFALAFTLLQPDLGITLVSPLVSSNPFFQEFFGVETSCFMPSEEPQVQEQNLPDSCENLTSENKEVVSGIVVSEESGTEAQFRSLNLRLISGKFNSARSARKDLGAAEKLDFDKFKCSHTKEIALERELEEFVGSLLREFDLCKVSLHDLLGDLPLEVVAQVSRKDTEIANWLDVHASKCNEIVALYSELRDRVATLRSLTNEDLPLTLSAISCENLNSMLTSVKTCLHEVNSKIEGISKLCFDVDALKQSVRDCLSPSKSQSMFKLSKADVKRLITYARIYTDYFFLVPLSVRHLIEIEELNEMNSAEIVDLFVDFLNFGYIKEDEESYYSLLSFIPIQNLQDLMAVGHETFLRHIVLHTFRESLLRHHPLFFNMIWPFSGWGDREKVVGPRLLELFDALQVLMQMQNIHRVIDAIVSNHNLGCECINVADQSLQQKANELSVLIERSIGMSGHYFKLRQITQNLYFKPLAPLVRQRRHVEVKGISAKLRSDFDKGYLESSVLGEYSDTNSLRASHKESLRRYVKSLLDSIDSWVQMETSARKGNTDYSSNSKLVEIRTLINEMGDEREICVSSAVVGSIKWLETEVKNIIFQARSGSLGVPAFSFYGEIPALETFFSDDNTSLAENHKYTRVFLPSWVDATPRSRCLWTCYINGQVTWRDFFQEALASFLRPKDESCERVLEDYLSARELEALLEATKHSSLSCHQEARNYEKVAVDLLSEKKVLEGEVDSLSTLVSEMLRQINEKEIEPKLISINDELVEVMLDIDRYCFEQAYEKLNKLNGTFAKIKEKVSENSIINEKHKSTLITWLKSAGLVGLESQSLGTLEQLKQQVLQDNAERRTFINRLQKTKHQQLPGFFVKAINQFIREADTPECWPTAENSAQVEFIIECYFDITKDWWSILGVLQKEDRTYIQLMHILELLATRLKDELTALLKNPDGSILSMIMLAINNSSKTVQEYHHLLQVSGLLAADGERLSSDDVPKDSTYEAAINRVIKVLPNSSLLPVDTSGKVVQETIDLFTRGQYVDVVEQAITSYLWCVSNNPELTHPILAMVAWSAYKSGSRTYERLATDAIGILLRNHIVLKRRAGIEAKTILSWWLSYNGFTSERDRDTASYLNSYLESLDGFPAGNPQREAFFVLFKIADPKVSIKCLWEELTGAKDVHRGRTALLVLAFDMADEDALDVIFREYGGEAEKYLRAFAALIRRAMVDPSAKLHTAIRQNIRRVHVGLKNVAFKNFTERLVNRLDFNISQVSVLIAKSFEMTNMDGYYRGIITVTPDETDPPLSLSVNISESSDFVVHPSSRSTSSVCQNNLLLSTVEIEVIAKPKASASSTGIVLEVSGETASGQVISEIIREDVALECEEYESLTRNEILEIYEGYDSKPVTGHAFVGRIEEIGVLERALSKENPGAVILYGVRRIGKTSLLNEIKRRFCFTERHGSSILILRIPVDKLELRPEKVFADSFFNLIKFSVSRDIKNEGYRSVVYKQGLALKDIELAAQFSQEDDLLPFGYKLKEYLLRLKKLVGNKFHTAVLCFDEFDKLLEIYRKGYENDVEQLINQLRNIATEEPDLGIVLAGSDLMKAVIGRYRSAMYGSATTLEVGGFDNNGNRKYAEMIICPQGLRGRRLFPETVINEIIRITAGHPYYMRIVACATAYLSNRRRVTVSVVYQAVQGLIRNEILQGDLPDPNNLIKQPLQWVGIVESDLDGLLAKLLLLAIARHTTLEKPDVRWGAISFDDELIGIFPVDKWIQIRESLVEAGLLLHKERYLLTFKYPILAEALRFGWEIEFDSTKRLIEFKVGTLT